LSGARQVQFLLNRVGTKFIGFSLFLAMKTFAIIICLVVSFTYAIAQEIPLQQLNLDKGYAVEGYDLVSYFKKAKPSKGKENFKVNYKGVMYLFTDNNNKNEFLKSPDKYLPQYGGWCAYAMGEKGEKVEVDPETFKIINGKLYLFYNKFFNNTLDSWNKNESVLLPKANENWNKFIQRKN